MLKQVLESSGFGSAQPDILYIYGPTIIKDFCVHLQIMIIAWTFPQPRISFFVYSISSLFLSINAEVLFDFEAIMNLSPTLRPLCKVSNYRLKNDNLFVWFPIEIGKAEPAVVENVNKGL